MSWDKTLVNERPTFAESDDDRTDSGVDPSWFERRPGEARASDEEDQVARATKRARIERTRTDTVVDRPRPSASASRRPKDLLSIWRSSGGAAVPAERMGAAHGAERPGALPPPLPPPPQAPPPVNPHAQARPSHAPPRPKTNGRQTAKGHAPVIVVAPPGSMLVDDAADTWPPERTPLPAPQSLVRTAEVPRIEPEVLPAVELGGPTVPVPLFSPEELLGEPALVSPSATSVEPLPMTILPVATESPAPVTPEPVFYPTREIILAPVAPAPLEIAVASVIVDPIAAAPAVAVTERGFATVSPPLYIPVEPSATEAPEAQPLFMSAPVSSTPAEQTWFDQGSVAASPEPEAAPLWTPPSEPAAAWTPPATELAPEHPVASDTPAPDALTKRGKVIAVFGCRGGTGCTTISVNMASALARAGREVCVVDLDLLLGDVLIALDLEPKISVTAVAREGATMDGAALKRRLQRHDVGFYALAQAGRIDDMDDEIAQRVPDLLRVLAAQFDAVIIDGLRDFADHAVAAMDAADEIALVFTQDVTGVRRAARVVELCRKLGYDDRKLRLLLNRHHPSSRVKLGEIERALGLPITGSITNDYRATQAAQDAGVVLSDLRRKSRAADDVARIALDLVPNPHEAPARKGAGFFARVFGGKR